MYKMSQRHPVWVAENHVNPCNSVGRFSFEDKGSVQFTLLWWYYEKDILTKVLRPNS
jgi:hypothetical protein